MMDIHRGRPKAPPENIVVDTLRKCEARQLKSTNTSISY